MNRIARADCLFLELTTSVRNDLVRVGIGARAGTGLKNVEWKVVVELTLNHFLRSLDDERGAMRIEQTKIVIRLRRSPFEQTEGANERPGKSITADGKIQNRALRRSTVKSGLRNGHLAHRVLLHPHCPAAHAE